LRSSAQAMVACPVSRSDSANVPNVLRACKCYWHLMCYHRDTDHRPRSGLRSGAFPAWSEVCRRWRRAAGTPALNQRYYSTAGPAQPRGPPAASPLGKISIAPIVRFQVVGSCTPRPQCGAPKNALNTHSRKAQPGRIQNRAPPKALVQRGLRERSAPRGNQHQGHEGLC
jgi:hypothetical protein